MLLFTIEGVVQMGDKKGSMLGYPTANIPCDTSIESGIYAGEVVWKGIAYPAAIYKEGGKNVVEAHLLDFSGTLYGERMTLRAYYKVRDVKTFSKKEDLIAAIAKDIINVKNYLELIRFPHPLLSEEGLGEV